ncbi:MAG: hypothetical protein LBK44_03850 [Spirochaetales bacterium]|jgi:hypothetical protein|nr:hypothetical protein [Spirochaetales bacterium]
MDLDKIADIFSINHDGKIIKLEKKDNILEIKVEIAYLAELRNNTDKILNYKISGCSGLKFVDICENSKIYTNIQEIEKMELTILEAKRRDNIIIIGVCSQKCPYGELQLCANDIIIYDQNNGEIKYSELKKMAKEYWEARERK